jgi:hypothetical protein
VQGIECPETIPSICLEMLTDTFPSDFLETRTDTFPSVFLETEMGTFPSIFPEMETDTIPSILLEMGTTTFRSIFLEQKGHISFLFLDVFVLVLLRIPLHIVPQESGINISSPIPATLSP